MCRPYPIRRAETTPALVPVGIVESPLTDPAAAPKQGTAGAPEAIDGTPILDIKVALDTDR